MSPKPPAPAPAPTAIASESEDHTTFSNHTLPIGTMVGGLQITGLIGEGGFGVVYLAFDTTLQRQVALKEYMPSSLASRAQNSADVSVKSPRFLDTFNAGLRSFVNEARLLAHFDHPSLVKVHQFWQANRTAYMVMPYYQGPTLKAHVATLRATGSRPDENMLRQWLVPLLDALETMHGENCFHRDIAPDNILLTSNGPLLLDFGAARRVISDMTQALTVILKPGYAPIEQYGDVATMTQGAWTDLYALASVVYYCITGHSPITSVERVMGDPLPRLSRVAAGQYSSTFLGAIDAALAVRPADRPQSVAEFRAMLDGHAQPRLPVDHAAPPAAGVPAAPAVPAAFALDQTVPRTSPTQGGYAPTLPMQAPAASPTQHAPAGAFNPTGAFAPTTPEAGRQPAQAALQAAAPAPFGAGHTPATAAPPAAAAPATAAPAAPTKSRGTLIAAGVAAVALVVGGGVVIQQRGAAGAGNANPATPALPGNATGGPPASRTTATAPNTSNPPNAMTPSQAPPPPTSTGGTNAAPAPTPFPPPTATASPSPAAANPANVPAEAERAPRPGAALARAAAASRAQARASEPGPRMGARRAAEGGMATANAPRAGGTNGSDRSPSGTVAFPVPGGSPPAAQGGAAPAGPATAATNPAPPPPERAAAPAANTTPPRASASAARCAELLKKGNQGTLTLEDAAFLRKECR